MPGAVPGHVGTGAAEEVVVVVDDVEEISEVVDDGSRDVVLDVVLDASLEIVLEVVLTVELEGVEVVDGPGGRRFLTVEPEVLTRLTDEAMDMLTGLKADLEGALGKALCELITRDEVWATERRVDRLLSTKRHPRPSGDWPPVPWPPF